MSLSQQTVFERPADDRKRSVYGFVLALVCTVLALVVANAKFAPAPAGSGISNDVATIFLATQFP
jgi:heme/copper-type cytochrome/quinol oxidase subunit 4